MFNSSYKWHCLLAKYIVCLSVLQKQQYISAIANQHSESGYFMILAFIVYISQNKTQAAICFKLLSSVIKLMKIRERPSI